MSKKKYTLKQCKADMLLLWGILKDNPHITNKEHAIGLINTIEEIRRFNNMENFCPCCEYVEKNHYVDPEDDSCNPCGFCPCWDDSIGEGCCEMVYNGETFLGGEYELWSCAINNETRQKEAQLIYDRALRIEV